MKLPVLPAVLAASVLAVTVYLVWIDQQKPPLPHLKRTEAAAPVPAPQWPKTPSTSQTERRPAGALIKCTEGKKVTYQDHPCTAGVESYVTGDRVSVLPAR